MRLIDADALEARMYHDAFEVDSDMQKWDSGCWIRYKMFENAIEDAPTIEERKKGEWEEKTVCDEDVIEQWQSARCSTCGKYHTTPYLYYFDEYNYCPNCGADMRGDNHETD